MKQQELYEKMLKEQEERIQEMESLISILEKQNNLKDQMLAELQKVNQMHEKYISRYYKDGYNLYRRIEEYMWNHLLFLHDHSVPATNNEAERLLRSYKRKQQQAVSFRSFENIDHLCQCMSTLAMMRQKEETDNIFDRVSQIFG